MFQRKGYATQDYWECPIPRQQRVYIKVTVRTHKKYAKNPLALRINDKKKKYFCQITTLDKFKYNNFPPVLATPVKLQPTLAITQMKG